MDQTLNDMVYRSRINNSVRTWNDHVNGNKTNEGTIIASDGTEYKKIDGKLVMACPDKKAVRFLNRKLAEYGLLKDKKGMGEVSAEVVNSSSEMIVGM